MDIKRVAEHLAEALLKEFTIGSFDSFCDEIDFSHVDKQELIDFLATELREAE